MKTLSICAIVHCLLASTVLAQSPIQPGDRIAIVGNTFADQLRIYGYLETLLVQYSVDDPISLRNLGWGGDMLTARDRPTNFPSEESTLAAHKTDVIIACFGMGESFNGVSQINFFKRDLKAFIDSHTGKKYNGKSEVRLVLVSPIACENLGGRTPARENRNRELKAYTRAMSEVATDAELPFVDLFEPSLYLMNEPQGPRLTTNGIHLNQYGYWAICKPFFDQLVTNERKTRRDRWRLSIDAQTNTGNAQGVEISRLNKDGSGISFVVTERSFPSLRPPAASPLPPQLELDRDTLRVVNLRPGNYTLSIDGKAVVTKSHEVWAAGVTIDASPAHFALEELREAINEKNLQFTYGWKALNQVHIVGERRGSPSGRVLPQEVVEFHRLAEQRESELGKSIELKTRQWRLNLVNKDR